jgi:hypothetical protein
MKHNKFINKKGLLIFVCFLLLIGIFLINKPNDEKAAYIQPDYSESRTIKDKENNIIINFETCTQDKKRKDVGFGSTTIAIIGKSGKYCILRYGGEIENPNWDGELPVKCSVPQEYGEVEFTTNNYGIDFQPIEKYCSK